MKHEPSTLDAASDLRRCIYASFSKDKFQDTNFIMFFEHAKKILKNKKVSNEILERIKKFENEKYNENYKREDLLTASVLLQNK